MKQSTACVLICVALCAILAVESKCPNPPTVQNFQIADYLGGWYEIADNAKFRKEFEQGLECTKANYSLEADGKTVRVVNGGNKGGPNGTLTTAIGKALQVDGAKLKVSFFGPFYGPYWITQLYGDASQGYEVSVVYSCTDVLGFIHVEDLWILSRTPELPSGITLEMLYDKATQMGINVTALDMGPTYQGKDCVYKM